VSHGMEQLNVLAEKVTALLEAHGRLQQENRELQEAVGRCRDRVRELETTLRSREELLASVEHKVDDLLGKLADFAAREASPPAGSSLLPDAGGETY